MKVIRCTRRLAKRSFVGKQSACSSIEMVTIHPGDVSWPRCACLAIFPFIGRSVIIDQIIHHQKQSNGSVPNVAIPMADARRRCSVVQALTKAEVTGRIDIMVADSTPLWSEMGSPAEGTLTEPPSRVCTGFSFELKSDAV